MSKTWKMTKWKIWDIWSLRDIILTMYGWFWKWGILFLEGFKANYLMRQFSRCLEGALTFWPQNFPSLCSRQFGAKKVLALSKYPLKYSIIKLVNFTLLLIHIRKILSFKGWDGCWYDGSESDSIPLSENNTVLISCYLNTVLQAEMDVDMTVQNQIVFLTLHEEE